MPLNGHSSLNYPPSTRRKAKTRWSSGQSEEPPNQNRSDENEHESDWLMASRQNSTGLDILEGKWHLYDALIDIQYNENSFTDCQTMLNVQDH